MNVCVCAGVTKMRRVMLCACCHTWSSTTTMAGVLIGMSLLPAGSRICVHAQQACRLQEVAI